MTSSDEPYQWEQELIARGWVRTRRGSLSYPHKINCTALYSVDEKSMYAIREGELWISDILIEWYSTEKENADGDEIGCVDRVYGIGKHPHLHGISAGYDHCEQNKIYLERSKLCLGELDDHRENVSKFIDLLLPSLRTPRYCSDPEWSLSYRPTMEEIIARDEPSSEVL